MTDSIPSETGTEMPTCMLRWFTTPPDPTCSPVLQQKWIVRHEKTGGAVWAYEEWRDVPTENFYD